MDSSADEAVPAAFHGSPGEAGTHEFRSTSPRYDGVTSYTSHQVDPGDILPAWQAMAIMQFLQAPAGDEVERLLGAFNRDGPGFVRADEASMGPGAMIEPLLLSEVALVV